AERKTYKDHKVEPRVQYFNPVKSHPQGVVVEQAITWNAFPKELLRNLDREEAMAEADGLRPLSAYRRASGDVLDRTFYRPHNEWNITHGIMHLAAPPNTLTAEIQLGGDASVVRKSDRGRLLVDADVLVCSTGYGGPDRNSDPTIGGAVNALARLGAMITLKN